MDTRNNNRVQNMTIEDKLNSIISSSKINIESNINEFRYILKKINDNENGSIAKKKKDYEIRLYYNSDDFSLQNLNIYIA